MGKYYGRIGYNVGTKETTPGVWTEDIVERLYVGDVFRNTRRWEQGEGLNDNLQINNSISIVADPFAYENFHMMRYIHWMGAKWKVTNVEVQYPRLLLTIGGVYNEETAGAS